jgi:hypothetical protein
MAVPASTGRSTDTAGFSKMKLGSVRDGMYVVMISIAVDGQLL